MTDEQTMTLAEQIDEAFEKIAMVDRNLAANSCERPAVGIGGSRSYVVSPAGEEASVMHDPGHGVNLAPSPFDASSWLAGFTMLGGIYMLGADRRLAFVAHGPCGPDLAEMMRQLMGEPIRQEAVRVAIEQRQMVEVAA